jgi:hypothetical protein
MTTSQGGSLSTTTLEKNKMTMNQKAHRHLLHLRKKPREVDVHLLATNALIIFWRKVIYNTISATFSTTLLQHYFCGIASTPPLQHCLL